MVPGTQVLHIEPTLSEMKYSKKERDPGKRSLSNDLSPGIHREKLLGLSPFQKQLFSRKERHRLSLLPIEPLQLAEISSSSFGKKVKELLYHFVNSLPAWLRDKVLLLNCES